MQPRYHSFKPLPTNIADKLRERTGKKTDFMKNTFWDGNNNSDKSINTQQVQ